MKIILIIFLMVFFIFILSLAFPTCGKTHIVTKEDSDGRLLLEAKYRICRPWFEWIMNPKLFKEK